MCYRQLRQETVNMTKVDPGRVVRAFVKEMGGSEEASKWADRLLLHWRQNPSVQFGSLNILLSARAAALLVSQSREHDELPTIGAAWLESRARFCPRHSFERVANAAVALRTERNSDLPRSLLPKLRTKLSAIWTSCHESAVDMVELSFAVTDEGELPPPELALDLAASVAGWHPELRDRVDALRWILRALANRDSMVEGFAGAPRYLLIAKDVDALLRDVSIRSEATTALWREKMLDAGAVAVSLGSKPTNREKVRTLRRQSRLLGLPHANRYVYPSFQLDLDQRRIYPTVDRVNRLLRAADDPWGVASWWMSDNALLGARPCNFVTGERAHDVWRAACASVDADPEKEHPTELSVGAAG